MLDAWLLPGLASGFQIPLGRIPGSFCVHVGFSVVGTMRFDGVASLFLGPGVRAGSERGEGADNPFLLIEASCGGGRSALYHSIDVLCNGRAGISGHDNGVRWLPDRPYDVVVTYQKEDKTLSATIADRLTGKSIGKWATSPLSDNELPSTTHPWSFGVLSIKPGKPAARIRVDRIVLDTSSPLEFGPAKINVPPGWLRYREGAYEAPEIPHANPLVAALSSSLLALDQPGDSPSASQPLIAVARQLAARCRDATRHAAMAWTQKGAPEVMPASAALRASLRDAVHVFASLEDALIRKLDNGLQTRRDYLLDKALTDLQGSISEAWITLRLQPTGDSQEAQSAWQLGRTMARVRRLLQMRPPWKSLGPR